MLRGSTKAPLDHAYFSTSFPFDTNTSFVFNLVVSWTALSTFEIHAHVDDLLSSHECPELTGWLAQLPKGFERPLQ